MSQVYILYKKEPLLVESTMNNTARKINTF